MKIKNFNDLSLEIEAIIPNAAEKKEEVKVKEIVEKPAVEINFEMFNINNKPKKAGIDYHDLSQKKPKDMDTILDKYMSRGDKSIK